MSDYFEELLKGVLVENLPLLNGMVTEIEDDKLITPLGYLKDKNLVQKIKNYKLKSRLEKE